MSLAVPLWCMGEVGPEPEDGVDKAVTAWLEQN